MNLVNEVMKQHSEFCNLETRVPDLKYIFKKYNYDEVVIVDDERHPLGIVKSDSLTDDALKNILHPFDIKAQKIMIKIPISVKNTATVEDCLKLMKENHISLLPVTDDFGHTLGIVKEGDLLKTNWH